ncbi:unnamed protein product [Medioppia subpectinata]|uniref:Nose resistant-to-fluoxetine protein N-terminal domain-containing protein n=1 Tax=Medioppia subpectinata TaxID=1979941 RepID=A0A7R9L0J6_9ACAR|nr:unnamed protein product [Medioppia subpectinata]CAG2112969.1 unnamed protein product [Medioppia subpectinata]
MLSDDHNNDEYKGWQSVIDASDILKNDPKVRFISRIVSSVNVSAECRESVRNTLQSFEGLEDWAFQMLNSWGDFPPKGVMEGTITDFGDYDQCLSIEPNLSIGRSQYCLVDLEVPMPKPLVSENINYFDIIDVLPKSVNKSSNNIFVKLSRDASYFYFFFLRTGICTPDKCTKHDIKLMVHKSFLNTGLKLRNISCEVKTPNKLNWVQILAINSFGSLFYSSIPFY